ncbi:GumC family protein [Dyadobacter subterraneus]|uniref:Lipopolysaccharide biosynthesis protein n=1 Tax=Dyadobacter subterraneus TaxID=2773304 RepID=A0ABR9WDC7_9BACT|nr:lipopolysaccharide biosynthesis protein [Dyadobacter subterraneus]MBE9463134.1 lipopolysaccharide biosynthesis protein [Dyadobacter subterraneus]
MTELLLFFKLLYRNRITLIAIPLVTIVLCYFLVKELPDVYKSHGSISTGLVDKTEQVLSMGEKDQDAEINRKFDNLIQMMTLKKVLDQVSYQLLLHDLKAAPGDRFRKFGKTAESMDKATVKQYIALITKKHSIREELMPGSKQNNVIIAMVNEADYGHSAISSKISIYRLKSSDYISLDSEAESPELAAFLINSLTTEFISYYASRLIDNNKLAISFLANFLGQKRSTLTERMNVLRTYKIKNRVLNLNEQARSLYGQIAEYEAKREIAEKDIVAYSAAIRNIDNKFNPADRRYLESALVNINQEIVATKLQLRSLNDTYVRNNFDARYKPGLDSLQTKLTRQIGEASDRYIYNPMVAKDNLVSQKLNLEISLELSSNSVSSIQQELKRLNRKFDALVPNEAEIQEFETGIDIASKEYMEALQRFNDVSLASSFPVFLKQSEKGMPGSIQPSKKMVLLILSGIISITFCLFVFFILYYFDKSIRYPLQLANETDIPVLGYLNQVSGGMDLGKIQNESSREKSIILFRNLIRSIRYELDSEYPDPKMIVITSLGEGEGKTLLTISLAWAFSKVNKKVLVIDGNFSSQSITGLNINAVSLDEILNGQKQLSAMTGEDDISIVGNRGQDTSLNEIAPANQVREVLEQLKSNFDIILVEADSLVAMNKAKEWISYADVTVGAFASGKTIKPEDRSKIDYFKSLENKFSGWVLTGTRDIPEQAGKLNKKISV